VEVRAEKGSSGVERRAIQPVEGCGVGEPVHLRTTGAHEEPHSVQSCRQPARSLIH
jgi:hypothetical protein